VLRRQTDTKKKIEAIVTAHDPQHPAAALCNQIVEVIFSAYSAITPTVLRFAYNLAVSQSAKPEQHERVVDRLAQPLHAAIARDKTGTFRSFEDQELMLYLRGVVYLCRYPLLESNPLYGTPEHKRIVLNFMVRVLSQPAA
jgi:hypothetical protein